jgi:hypothetical protein
MATQPSSEQFYRPTKPVKPTTKTYSTSRFRAVSLRHFACVLTSLRLRGDLCDALRSEWRTLREGAADGNLPRRDAARASYYCGSQPASTTCAACAERRVTLCQKIVTTPTTSQNRSTISARTVNGHNLRVIRFIAARTVFGAVHSARTPGTQYRQWNKQHGGVYEISATHPTDSRARVYRCKPHPHIPRLCGRSARLASVRGLVRFPGYRLIGSHAVRLVYSALLVAAQGRASKSWTGFRRAQRFH